MYVAYFAMAAIFALVALGPVMSFKPLPFSGDGSPQRQAAYLIVVALALWVARPLQTPRRLLVLPISLVITFTWCWISLTWSIVPDVAMRRLILTTILAWTIFLLIDQLGYRRTLSIMRFSLVLMLIANYVAVIAFPLTGIHQAGEVGDEALTGNWRGIMIQKNFAGAVCAMSVMSLLFDAKAMRQWLRALLLAATLLFLIKTSSKTSMGILVIAVCFGWMFLRYNPSYRSLVIPSLAILACIIAFFVMTNWDALIAPFYSRDALTGRVQIWPPMLAYSRDNPIFGTGYGSFWNIGLGKSPIFEYAKGWVLGYAAQGHNGYIDLLVTIGYPGLIMAITATFLVPMGRLLASKTIARQQGALLISMLVFCAGHNLTESSILDRDTIVQVFLMITLALIRVSVVTPAAGILDHQKRLPVKHSPGMVREKLA